MKNQFLVLLSMVVLTLGVDAQADLKNGRRAARKCVACHDLSKARKNAMGPYLWGIFGQPAGQVPGYEYTPAHREKGAQLVWDEQNLDGYIKNPRQFIPGNRMGGFVGLPDARERADLIEYLKTLRD